MEILYRGRDRTVHDERFISALKEMSRVTSIFQSYSSNESNIATKDITFDLEIITPLTGQYQREKTFKTGKKIGISMAFDINEEIIDDQSKMDFVATLNELFGIVVDCEYIRDTLRELYHYKGEIWVVPYGCDFEDFFATAANPSPVLDLIVNRKWTKNYGNEVILEALDLIRDKVELRAKFVGGGTEFVQLRNKFRHLELQGIVRYLPSLTKEQMISEFRNNWIYISASKSDGTSISLLEAMSAGMVCVTSDFAPNKEWIKDGQSGYTFSKNSPQSLAEVLLTISNLSAMARKEIRDSAIAKAKKEGDWKKNKVKFQEAVQSCFSGSL